MQNFRQRLGNFLEGVMCKYLVEWSAEKRMYEQKNIAKREPRPLYQGNWNLFEENNNNNVAHLSFFLFWFNQWMFWFLCDHVDFDSAFPAVYGHFPQGLAHAVPAAPPGIREGKKNIKNNKTLMRDYPNFN